VVNELDSTPSIQGGRIPSLDGLRAISICLVLLAHLVGTRSFPLTLTSGYLLALGELGVHVFFVISGFLITRLLLDELAGTGRISLPEFYFRRTMRIFPAYYTFLLASRPRRAPCFAPRDMSNASHTRPTTIWRDRGSSDTRGRCRSKSSST
jgi:peptidoglycan/LPS O-acetylase OafA/YrhL